MTDALTPDQARCNLLEQIISRQAGEAATREANLRLQVLQLENALQKYQDHINDLTTQSEQRLAAVEAVEARVRDLENEIEELVQMVPRPAGS